ncbi:epididymal protein 13 isoform X3 [Acinonyx jubatus]|uniref:Epididymal protein 13 isoform X3 n=1 Tax=Acinonyx jubatus TaxID=32536 RepID=A0ABM3P4Q8_ACIJB|nr:epididymal protein 13 isoform X3 [Acinonyx jubatus]
MDSTLWTLSATMVLPPGTTLLLGWVTSEILGLLSLQVLSEETNDCKEEGKISLATATSTKKPPTKRTRWNLLKCTYMMVTFLFVSYNKGDWCYCHSCSTEVDIRYVTARRAFSPPSPW